MVQTKKIIYSLLFSFIGIATFAQHFNATSSNQFEPDNTLLSSNTDFKEFTKSNDSNYSFSKENSFEFNSPIHINDSIVYPPATRDFRRLGYNTGLFVGATVVIFGVLWVLPENVTNWDKEDMRENGITTKWKENVKAGPVIDEDNFFFNYITHPYAGAVYYMTARSSGFTILESFGYSALMSTFFWEYGVEAFAEIPSWQDIIITPVMGSVFGEGFFYAKKSILKNDSRVLNSRFLGKTSLFLMDPFNTILDGCGYKQKVKTQFNVAPVGFNPYTKNTTWGLNFTATF